MVSGSEEQNEKYFIRINSTGHATWFYPSILYSPCILDMTQFPWDKQVCKLAFGSWAYPIRIIDIHSYIPEGRGPGGDMTVYVGDGQWNFVNFPVERCILQLQPGNISTLVYSMHLHRRPLTFVINILVPCISISICGLLVFLLPPDSGEKVSLSVTILLSDSVFLLIIQESMPVQSLTIPRISKYTHS